MSQVTERARVEERRATGMDAERRVHRFVGFTFFALAAYVLVIAV